MAAAPTQNNPNLAGAILYHGPASDALAHFAKVGFVCPPRKDMASFLQELSTPAGQLQYASPVRGTVSWAREHGHGAPWRWLAVSELV